MEMREAVKQKERIFLTVSLREFDFLLINQQQDPGTIAHSNPGCPMSMLWTRLRKFHEIHHSSLTAIDWGINGWEFGNIIIGWRKGGGNASYNLENHCRSVGFVTISLVLSRWLIIVSQLSCFISRFVLHCCIWFLQGSKHAFAVWLEDTVQCSDAWYVMTYQVN